MEYRKFDSLGPAIVITRPFVPHVVVISEIRAILPFPEPPDSLLRRMLSGRFRLSHLPVYRKKKRSA